jgi:para-aminobenzoate synthetase / 4-amino-4-deoxychorismate lyase
MRGEVVVQTQSPTGWLRFTNPIEIVAAASLDEVLPALRRVEEQVTERSYYAAGFIAYEAAPAFESVLRVRDAADLPLLWFGLYVRAEPIAHLPQPDRSPDPIGPWTPTVAWSEYERAINTIREHIAEGRTYQVNYTYRLRAPFSGDPWSFFVTLAHKQPLGYSAYLDIGSHVICSASPELFFRLNGRTVLSKPMKGTAPRGKTLTDDRAQMAWLQQSEKNRAENVMIVDMIRNDLGRIAEIGSVQVPQLFEIERYPTVLQMTSTVTAQTDAPLSQIMLALFPCASITGAPKVSTMKFIADLETTPRGVYTGAIGYLTPARAAERIAQFNVAIRTVTIDREAQQAEYGVGGGIVWDSDAADEYRECEIKTRVLTGSPPEFELLEALLWTPADGYFLFDRHVARLRDSAEYFGFPFERAVLIDWLEKVRRPLPAVDHKVRVALNRSGEFSITATPLSAIPRPPVQRVTLARNPIDSGDIFLYHKTSRRTVYDRARAERPTCDDVILWNERGEITESCSANVVIDLNGELITPPIASGLLGGTFCGELLEQGQIAERVITIEMLRTARRRWLLNSVRKWMDALLLDDAEGRPC